MTAAPATLGRLLTAAQPTPANDADLLARFAADRDEAAFAELARRHGPMVRAVARRAVRDRHLADDVAQAVFLVLARKAGRLARPDRLAGWLFGVARRLARKAAGRLRRDARRTRPFADQPAPLVPPPGWDDVVRVLDEELARLPGDEQAALVLCYLEGLTRDEAARTCGWSVRTLGRRLAAGRDRLRGRLERRGVEFGAVLAALAVGTATDGADRPLPLPPEAAPGGRAAALARAYLRPVGRIAAVGWAVVVAAGLATGLAAGPRSDPPSPPPVAQPVVAAAPDLPDGAAVRLGSTALRHPDTLLHLRFTADGTQLLSYGRGKIRRWDVKTGAAVPHPARDVTTTFGTTFLAPDPMKLIAPHVDHNPTRFSVREYDLATGRHAERFVIPPRADRDGRPAGIGLERFVLSPDGTLLAEGNGYEVYLWDVTAGRVRHHLKPPGGAGSALFTPDGKHLMTAGGEERVVRFWDVGTGKETRVLTREGSRAGASGLAVSADGRWVAATDNSHLLGVGTEMTVWDLIGAGPPRVVTLADGFGFGLLAFGPDGTLYAVSGPFEPGITSVVTRWDAATGRLMARWAGPVGRVAAAAVHPGGEILALGTLPGVIQLYGTTTGAEVVRPPALSARVIGIAFDPAGREVRGVGTDGSAAVWDAAAGTQRSRRNPPFTLPPAGKVAPVIPSPDGRWVVTFAPNPAGPPQPRWLATQWDAATGERVLTRGVGGRVKELIPIPSGKLLAGLVETEGGYYALVWDSATGEGPVGAAPFVDQQHGCWAAFADGKTFLTINAEQATVYDLTAGKERFSWSLADHDVLGRRLPGEGRAAAFVRAVAAAPDGKTLAISVGGPAYIDPARRTDNLVLVEAATGKVIRRVPTPETSASWLMFSPDGKRVAGPLCVWDAATLAEVRRFPARPEVTAAGFSPDGRRVATGHANGTALVWPVE
ncbi:MAG TPA: sigma-70 family RNA polymerase sigma factor [Urbifossiella sp.]|nr:sigma-70 family RNA polymerase sigma factor [Urbifossiella sp.]